MGVWVFCLLQRRRESPRRALLSSTRASRGKPGTQIRLIVLMDAMNGIHIDGGALIFRPLQRGHAARTRSFAWPTLRQNKSTA
jgi:hypothetical protein